MITIEEHGNGAVSTTKTSCPSCGHSMAEVEIRVEQCGVCHWHVKEPRQDVSVAVVLPPMFGSTTQG